MKIYSHSSPPPDPVRRLTKIVLTRARVTGRVQTERARALSAFVVVDWTAALTKIGFAFKYYFRRETRKAKIHCPTGGKSAAVAAAVQSYTAVIDRMCRCVKKQKKKTDFSKDKKKKIPMKTKIERMSEKLFPVKLFPLRYTFVIVITPYCFMMTRKKYFKISVYRGEKSSHFDLRKL